MVTQTMSPRRWRNIIQAAFEPHVGLEGVLIALEEWDENFASKAQYLEQIRPFTHVFAKKYGKPELRAVLTVSMFSLLSQPSVELADAPPTKIFDLVPDAPTERTPVSSSANTSTSSPAPRAESVTKSVTRPSSGLSVSATSASSATLSTPSKLSNTSLPSTQQAKVGTVRGMPALDMAPHKQTQVDVTLAAMLTQLRTLLTSSTDIEVVKAAAQYDRALLRCTKVKAVNMSEAQQMAWQQWLNYGTEQNLRAGIQLEQATQIVNAVYVFLSNEIGPVAADSHLNQAVASMEMKAGNKMLSPRVFL